MREKLDLRWTKYIFKLEDVLVNWSKDEKVFIGLALDVINVLIKINVCLKKLSLFPRF